MLFTVSIGEHTHSLTASFSVVQILVRTISDTHENQTTRSLLSESLKHLMNIKFVAVRVSECGCIDNL